MPKEDSVIFNNNYNDKAAIYTKSLVATLNLCKQAIQILAVTNLATANLRHRLDLLKDCSLQ